MAAFIVNLVIKKPLLCVGFPPHVFCLQNRGGEKIVLFGSARATTMCPVIRLRKRGNLVWTCEILRCRHAGYLGQVLEEQNKSMVGFLVLFVCN